MISVQLTNVTLILGAHTLFSDLTWSIQHDQKIGLIGPNGAGKSSLFKLITGEYQAEPGGGVVFSRGVETGYLAQEPQFDPGQTVLACALDGQPRWQAAKTRLEQLETRFAEPEVYNNPKKLARLLEEQQRCLDDFLALGGDEYPARAAAMLNGLGLPQNDFDKPLGALSGGQKKLVGLARLLLAQPPLLLLDEPDNHLDLPGKRYLEGLIREYPGAVVLVSHDRYLLDAVVTHIVELEDGRLTTYPGDYSGYVLDKEARLARQEQLFQIQKREIHRLETALKRYTLWTQKSDKFASRMHAMEARLARIDQLERPVLERRRMGLAFNGYRGSTKVLEVTGLRKSFGGRPVLRDVELLIVHGERVGLIGANGAGKSVLLRLLLGRETPDAGGPAGAGEIRIGPSVTVGYYAQEHETLEPEQTLLEAVRRGAPPGRSMSESDAVAFLGRYLFPYRMVRQPIKTLSGGERSRLQLALLVLSGANFLLLDEPTNNLDIASAEVLEAALDDFEGTALVISHDRYFLDSTVERLLELKDGRLTEHLGNYSDYEARV